MSGTLYLVWRYLTYHRLKSVILIGSLGLIIYLPLGLNVLVVQSADELTARAEATPLLVGAKGSPLELVLNSLYFESEPPPPSDFAEVQRIADSGLAEAIPLHVRFRARGYPIVGTTLEYFDYRRLDVAEGRPMALLGECVLGAALPELLGAGPGDSIVSSPESVFDLAGVYPLKLNVVGVLQRSHSPDDRSIFVDVKTAWVIQGLGHGHQDLAAPEADAAILAREGDTITANASVVQYNEITPDNVDSFHFHGELSEYPVTAIIAVPPDRKSGVLLMGRYEGDGEVSQILRPAEIIDELLATILTVRSYAIAGALVLGSATLATAALVFLLSLRLRRREIETMMKIGAPKGRVAALVVAEITIVLLAGSVLAGGLTLITASYGAFLIRGVLLA